MSPILSQWPLSLAMYFPIWDYAIIISLGQVCFSRIPKMSKVQIRSWRWLSAGRLLMRCLKRGGRSCRNLWWTPMCVCNLPSTVKDFQWIYNAISKPPFRNRNTETWQRWSVVVMPHSAERSISSYYLMHTDTCTVVHICLSDLNTTLSRTHHVIGPVTWLDMSMSEMSDTSERYPTGAW